jgi:hypothetical protein
MDILLGILVTVPCTCLLVTDATLSWHGWNENATFWFFISGFVFALPALTHQDGGESTEPILQKEKCS